jgi:hypothetical protein
MQLDYQNPADRLARRRKPWRKVIVWSAAALGALVLLALFLMPTFGRMREPAKRICCASNLRQIGQAALLYANENGGHLPPDLPTLFATQDIIPELLVCPSSDVNKATGATTRQVTSSLLAGDHISYAWTGAGLTINTPADVILAFDLERHVPKDTATTTGINVLLADGSATFVNDATAKAIWAHFVSGVRPIRLSVCTRPATTLPASAP